jgi:IPT/TIG domain
MRLSLVLLAVIATIGCGTGTVTQPRHLVGTGINVPSISMLEPSTIPVNSPTFTITVVGKNFGADALLYWNGTPVHTIPINSQQLMGEITTTDLQTVGLVPMFVRTGGQNSNTVDFEVTIQ